MEYFIKTKEFSKRAKKIGLSDTSLLRAINEMKNGLVDANLGANIYKKRVPISGQGKSSGSRTIIATNLGDRWFFVYCYRKNDKENINHSETEALKYLAEILLKLSEKDIQANILSKELELIYDK